MIHKPLVRSPIEGRLLATCFCCLLVIAVPIAAVAQGTQSSSSGTAVSGSEVHGAIRIDSLFRFIATLQESDRAEDLSATRLFVERQLGFEAGSPSSDELIELTQALENEFSSRDPGLREKFATPEGGLDLGLDGGFLEQRYLASGRALGQWLARRRSEGQDPEVLTQRLISAGGIGVTLASTDKSKEEFMAPWVRSCDRFEQAVKDQLGVVPEALRFDSD